MSIANETAFYTAVISSSSSRLNNKTVTLINSTENTTGSTTNEPTFLGASETVQNLINRFQDFKLVQAGNTPDNMLVNLGSTNVVLQAGYYSSIYPQVYNGGTPRTGKTTRPDTTTAIYYMRIL